MTSVHNNLSRGAGVSDMFEYREAEGGEGAHLDARLDLPRLHLIQNRAHLDPCIDLPRLHLIQFKNNRFTEMRSGSEENSYSRLTDGCVTQL